MREVVETGTDVAGIAIGDLALLAPLRTCEGLTECERELSRAMATGALWRADTGADGSYLVHIYVDAEPSPSVVDFLRDPMTINPFHVSSGCLLVAGLESFVGTPPDDHPLMGREITVARGDYHFIAYRVETPLDFVDSLFEQQATPSQRRARFLGNKLPEYLIIGTIAALVIGYFIYLRTVSPWLALSPLSLMIGAWVWQARFCRRSTYRAAEELYRGIGVEYPSFVVVMHGRTAAKMSRTEAGNDVPKEAQPTSRLTCVSARPISGTTARFVTKLPTHLSQNPGTCLPDQ